MKAKEQKIIYISKDYQPFIAVSALSYFFLIGLSVLRIRKR
jgi:hypothetical protein